MKKSYSTKDWTREVKDALSEALSIQEESVGKESEVPINNLYRMAAPIALYFHKIDNDELKEDLIEKTWGAVHYIREEIPSFKNKHKRCFAHAYLDTLIHLKLLSTSKAEKIIDILERQGKVEHH